MSGCFYFTVEEPRSKLRRFSSVRNFIIDIARLDPAPRSGDCGEHSVHKRQAQSKGAVAQIPFLLQIASLGLRLRQSARQWLTELRHCLRPFPRLDPGLPLSPSMRGIGGGSLRKRIWATAPKGLTLLELLVVIAILGTILLIVFPKIPLLEDYTLNAEARRVAGLFRYAQESASTKKMYYRLWFYPEKEVIEIESSANGIEFKKMQEPSLKGLTLKSGVDMTDIALSTLGKVSGGGVAVIFGPTGGAEPFSLHLKMRQRLLTIHYNPYSGKVKVLEGYV